MVLCYDTMLLYYVMILSMILCQALLTAFVEGRRGRVAMQGDHVVLEVRQVSMIRHPDRWQRVVLRMRGYEVM